MLLGSFQTLESILFPVILLAFGTIASQRGAQITL